MQYIIRKIYNYFDKDTEQENRKKAYESLLEDFQSACYRDTNFKYWNPNSLTTIKFSLYKFTNAPDQVAAYNLFKNTYTNNDGDIYFAGIKYKTINDLIKEIKDYKYIAEFIIES